MPAFGVTLKIKDFTEFRQAYKAYSDYWLLDLLYAQILYMEFFNGNGLL